MNTIKSTFALRFLSLFLFATLLFSLSSVAFAESAFTDVPQSHAEYVPILYTRDANIFGGYEDGSFKPGAEIKKAESLKVIFESTGIDTSKPYQENLMPDVRSDHWFANYVQAAYDLGFVKGNDDDGTFAGSDPVTLAVFLKMTLDAHGVDVSAFEGKEVVAGVAADKWYTAHVNYAFSFGIIPVEADGSVDPGRVLTRANVAETLYLLKIVMSGGDSQLLLTQSELNLAQVEIYIANDDISSAKKSSELAVDMTQQAYKNDPENGVILGAAKVARAYDWLVEAFILAIKGDDQGAAQLANDVIDKATEAWEANKDLQPIAAHLKDRAREILQQVGGVEE